MTLVALGLLVGMVGLVWVMIIDLMEADHQTNRPSPREQDTPLWRSHVASPRQRTEFRYDMSDKNVFLYGNRPVNNQQTLPLQVV